MRQQGFQIECYIKETLMAVSPHADCCVPLRALWGLSPKGCGHAGELHIAPPDPAQTRGVRLGV